MAEELNPGSSRLAGMVRTGDGCRALSSDQQTRDNGRYLVRMKQETLNNINHQRQTREIIKAPDDLRSILWAVHSTKLKSEARSNKKKSPQGILG